VTAREGDSDDELSWSMPTSSALTEKSNNGSVARKATQRAPGKENQPIFTTPGCTTRNANKRKHFEIDTSFSELSSTRNITDDSNFDAEPTMNTVSNE
jgi:hypothetical protein